MIWDAHRAHYDVIMTFSRDIAVSAEIILSTMYRTEAAKLLQGPLLLTRINFNSSMGNYKHYNVWGEITFPFPNFTGGTDEVWEWISNFIPHFTEQGIPDPYWD